jgi:hypothetical protein
MCAEILDLGLSCSPPVRRVSIVPPNSARIRVQISTVKLVSHIRKIQLNGNWGSCCPRSMPAFPACATAVQSVDAIHFKSHQQHYQGSLFADQIFHSIGMYHMAVGVGQTCRLN